MRKVGFKKRAINAIDSVCEFIESKNLLGSSAKWYVALIDFIDERANLSTIKFPLCNYHKFEQKGFSCFIYKKQWVIVFRYTDTTLTVYQLVHGSRLK